MHDYQLPLEGRDDVLEPQNGLLSSDDLTAHRAQVSGCGVGENLEKRER